VKQRCHQAAFGCPTFRTRKPDPPRSVPLACFTKLARMDGGRLVGIQMIDVSAQDEFPPGSIMPGEIFDAGVDPFVDIAADMQNLDLIIACDTSIAYRAGALGVAWPDGFTTESRECAIPTNAIM
jgi:hypothetical protein